MAASFTYLNVVFVLWCLMMTINGKRKQTRVGDIRLAGGPHQCEGRLEQYTNYFRGTYIGWAQVCNTNFDVKDARRVCSKLGCGTTTVNVTDISDYGRRSKFLTCYPSFVFCECLNLDVVEETTYIGVICFSCLIKGSTIVLFLSFTLALCHWSLLK